MVGKSKILRVCNVRTINNIQRCRNFKNISLSIKRQFVQQNNLRFNCISSGQNAYNCTSSSSCRICQSQGQIQKHHTMLHTNRSHNIVNNGNDLSSNSNIVRDDIQADVK